MFTQTGGQLGRHKEEQTGPKQLDQAGQRVGQKYREQRVGKGLYSERTEVYRGGRVVSHTAGVRLRHPLGGKELLGEKEAGRHRPAGPSSKPSRSKHLVCRDLLQAGQVHAPAVGGQLGCRRNEHQDRARG